MFVVSCITYQVMVVKPANVTKLRLHVFPNNKSSLQGIIPAISALVLTKVNLFELTNKMEMFADRFQHRLTDKL